MRTARVSLQPIVYVRPQPSERCNPGQKCEQPEIARNPQGMCVSGSHHKPATPEMGANPAAIKELHPIANMRRSHALPAPPENSANRQSKPANHSLCAPAAIRKMQPRLDMRTGSHCPPAPHSMSANRQPLRQCNPRMSCEPCSHIVSATHAYRATSPPPPHHAGGVGWGLLRFLRHLSLSINTKV